MTYMRGFLLGCLVTCAACSFSGRPQPPKGGVPYRVQKGDTLHDIGARFGVSGQRLQDFNEIDDPRKLRVGQLIQIPGAAARKSPAASVLSFAATTQPPQASGTTELRKVRLTPVKGYMGRLVMPVQEARLTSNFGWRSSKFHEGTDLAAPEGSRIYAAHDGEVVFTSESYSGYGRVVVIKGNNLLTVYGHNRRNRVSVGDVVSRGDWIADVGQSGDASGPHVHFETRVRDEQGLYAAVDPLTFFGRPLEHNPQAGG